VRHQTRLLLRFAWHVLRRFQEDKSLQLASSLTFTTLLSLVPLVTIALTLISAYPVFSGLGEQLQMFVLQHLLPEMSGKMISRYVEQFSERAGRLTAMGTLLLGVTAFMLMVTIERAFNSIWRVNRPRPLAQRLMMYWAGITLGPLLIGASLSITSYLVSVSLGVARQIPFAAEALLRVVPVVLTIAALSLLYFIVPNRQVRRIDAVIGGIAAGLLFELMKRGFALYVTKVPSYAMVYGAFASIPIFLLWIYLSWLVIVLGAIIAAAVPDYRYLRPSARRPVGALFADALAVLRVLVIAQQRAEVLDVASIAAAAGLPRDESEALLDRLATQGWVVRSALDHWSLACDPGRLTLGQVFHEFIFHSEALSEVGTAMQSGQSSGLEVRMALISEISSRFDAGVDSALNVPINSLLLDTAPAPAPAPGFAISSTA
jgi:membrane protein